MIILSSYNIMIGKATITWLAMSGGVITADKTSTITSANFLYFLKYSGVTIPILVKKNIKIGNSKIRPLASTEVRTRLV